MAGATGRTAAQRGCQAMFKPTESTVQRAFFFALLLGVTIAFIWLVRGFLQPIFWAVALGIVVYPLHRRVAQWLRARRWQPLPALPPWFSW